MEYVFRKWNYIKNILGCEYLLIFCDFDGTLSPIVETPDKAVIPKRTKEILKQLSQTSDCRIVIISGRDVKDLKSKIQLKNIVYSGSHGLEIEGNGFNFKTLVSQKNKNVLKKVKKSLTDKLSDINGILLEEKKYSLCVHYRLVNKKDIPLVLTIVKDVTLLYEKNKEIRVKPGKRVFEIMPPIEWDKGKAVLRILGERQKKIKNKNILPVYFGDDKTDEDAFNVLGDKGITVFVGKSKLSPTRITKSGSGEKPASGHPDKIGTLNSSISKARYYLKDTKEVAKILENILEMRKQ